VKATLNQESTVEMADNRRLDSTTGHRTSNVRKKHMNSPGIDRRVGRTRAALVNAFTELLLSQGYENMTVAQVAERANVGRSTLYEHFRTKDDLLRAALEKPFTTLSGAACAVPDRQALAGLLDHMRSNYAISRLLLAQPMRSRIARVLAEQVAGHLKALPTQAAVPAELAAVAIAEGQLAMIDAWFKEYPALNADAVASALAGLARSLACPPV
jgi:AcrR family transcriptional regulator